ncbi:hypothetical protein SCALM49S_04176 [Streptomyces californicus]
MASATVCGLPTKVWRPPTSMTSSRMERFRSSASSRHCRAVSARSLRKTECPFRKWASSSGSMPGSGPSGSYADRSRPQTASRWAIAVCGLTSSRLISSA